MSSTERNPAAGAFILVIKRKHRVVAARRGLVAIHVGLDQLVAELVIAVPRLAATTILCGDMLTLSCIQFGHALYHYFDIDIEQRPRPVQAANNAGLTERAASRKTVMVSCEALRNTF